MLAELIVLEEGLDRLGYRCHDVAHVYEINVVGMRHALAAVDQFQPLSLLCEATERQLAHLSVVTLDADRFVIERMNSHIVE